MSNRNKNKNNLKLIAYAGVLAALVFVGTELHIPTAIGYINLGDLVILLSSYILGPLALLPAAIGFGAFFSMLVTGQLLFSAMVDQLNLPPGHRTQIGGRRICGILLLIAGAFIIQNT